MRDRQRPPLLKMCCKYDIFVSHSTRTDPNARAFVNELVTELSRLGLSVFLDRLCLTDDEDLLLALDHAIETVELAVFVITPKVEESGWVALERAQFRRSGLKLLALRLNREISAPTDINWTEVIDAFESPFAHDVARTIVEVLKG